MNGWNGFTLIFKKAYKKDQCKFVPSVNFESYNCKISFVVLASQIK